MQTRPCTFTAQHVVCVLFLVHSPHAGHLIARCSVDSHAMKRKAGRRLERHPQLANLASHNYVSEHGLAVVLRSVKADPSILSASSRSSIKRTRDDAVTIKTPYGSLLQRLCIPFTDDSTQGLEFSYVNPICMLYHAATNCESFHDVVYARMQDNPSSPRNPL
jgi:hypothetical protein